MGGWCSLSSSSAGPAGAPWPPTPASWGSPVPVCAGRGWAEPVVDNRSTQKVFGVRKKRTILIMHFEPNKSLYKYVFGATKYLSYGFDSIILNYIVTAQLQPNTKLV